LTPAQRLWKDFEAEIVPGGEPLKAVLLLCATLPLAAAGLAGPCAHAQETHSTSDPAKPPATSLTSPHLIKQVVPNFPGIAKFEQLDGKVVLRITVAADGTVKKVNVTHGLPQLVPSATHAVAQWIYEPCRSNGVPTQCETTATIDFNLEKLDAVAGGMPPQQTSVTITVPPEVRFGPLLQASTAANTAAAAASATVPPPPPGVMRISGRIMATYLDKKVEPVYPVGIAGEVEGAVVMLATIGKAGDVSDVQMVSGPEPLRSAATYAVKQWKYRPYLIDGQPVEVQTTVTLNSIPRLHLQPQR
jgi:TonB family protein